MKDEPNNQTKKTMSDFEYIRATVDDEGGVDIHHKLKDCDIPGSVYYGDEDVSSWPDDDVKNLVKDMTGCDESDLEMIDLFRE